MMKKRFFSLLVVLSLLAFSSAFAVGTYSVGTEQETLTNKAVTAEIIEDLLGKPAGFEAQSKGRSYVDWVSPPSKVYGTSVNSRVYLSWSDVSAIKLYSIYEKVNGSWTYLKVTNIPSCNLKASDGTHTYGVSSVYNS